MIGIQEDLARNIATALETSMDPAALAQMAQAGTESVEAYQEYLRGLQSQTAASTTNEGQQAARRAYEHFERARTIDPGFFDAHVQAAAYWKSELSPSITFTGSSGLPPPQILQEYNTRIGLAVSSARNEIDRTRSLADRAALELRLREARELFDQYLAQRPNDEHARNELFAVLTMLADGPGLHAVLAYWKQKGQTDIRAANNYLNEAYRWGNVAEGADFALEAVRRWPESQPLVYQAHRTLLWAGRYREASEMAARHVALAPEGNPLVTAREACAAGDREQAERILRDLDPSQGGDPASRWILFNLLGDTAGETEALRPLENSGVLYQLASFLDYPKFDPRPYPALMAVLEREGVQRPPPAVPPFRCPPPRVPSVAVLPFVNMSADADNEYFSDGVSEEILNVLARIPELKVTARTSAFSYKGSDATIAQIARELGVSHVLEGSVRKAGTQVRVTAQLIEAGNDFHLWSETYDRELTNIFAIQDEIAGAIAEALKVRLLPAADQPNLTGTTNLEAYELYLQGVNLWHLRTGESLEQALRLFQQAIQLDPGFARAHAYLALTLGVLPDYGDRTLAEILPATRAAAEAALALDPDSVEAATALIQPLLAESPALLESIIERGRELIARDPGFATTHQWHATNLFTAGFVEEAAAAYRTGLELDPRSRIIHQNLAILLVVRGRFDEAAKLLENLDEFAPDYWDGMLARFLLYLASGQREAAEAAGNRLAGILGRTRNTVPLYLDLFFAPERRAAAAEILTFPRGNWWDPDNPSLIDEYALPFALAAAGVHDEALSALRQSLERRRDFYPVALIRASTLTGDFSCRPDVRAIYTELGLPPLPEPPDC
jgi:TolB-like protein/predicted Zn-dependent protease